MPRTAAIDAVLDATYRAWEANDADAFVAHYTEDATAVLPGSLRDGREAIRAAMAQGFSGPLKGSSTWNRRLGIHFLGDSDSDSDSDSDNDCAAIVVGESGILFAGGAKSPRPAGSTPPGSWRRRTARGASPATTTAHSGAELRALTVRQLSVRERVMAML
ncbi:YybH family protein [Kitasatospora sp. CB01950]|uniref:YybH family protein n=1 Tax=Kitasatospora sp. CB01950 TaxID=1703930 RepID=UPI001F528720|nr:SgcJ/EcaC family oxidoreductase [Kitasatospora sp. CB01950]